MPAVGIFSRPFGSAEKERERQKKSFLQQPPLTTPIDDLPVSPSGSAGTLTTMKKHSFYVWFLGAQESGGVRGDAYLKSALTSLLEREKDVEPVKVTLQVS